MKTEQSTPSVRDELYHDVAALRRGETLPNLPGVESKTERNKRLREAASQKKTDARKATIAREREEEAEAQVRVLDVAIDPDSVVVAKGLAEQQAALKAATHDPYKKIEAAAPGPSQITDSQRSGLEAARLVLHPELAQQQDSAAAQAQAITEQLPPTPGS
jgi:hypothetical protein